ncbi:type III pantothenate kinase [Candidatus Halobeggiatoa sp. HSG11]|nr:type III pantothenate kinase [Candidatus Halobeggiatoa sp. HSG11]
MILLVDVGNTAIKWAILKQNSLSTQQSILYNFNDLERILTKIWYMLDEPEEIWISNVAGPQIKKNIIDWTIKYWQCQPNFVKTTDYKCGVKNGYKNPEQLGIDRWLGLIGANKLETGTLCIVDCGTAVTVDILADGQHLGGIIAPGLNVMRTALSKNTFQLEDCEQSLTKFSLANETNDGIILGTSYAVLGLLEYVMNELNEQPKLILTGGDAVVIKPFLSRTYRYIPDLVLQGLKTVLS